ncbi:MAG: hypothetical protein KatS3mg027_1598 [Bacteroidia bacterium]|nr:MAG: hypothetical protein KatS3mg027_1598 [Bacteroidia bacterium]
MKKSRWFFILIVAGTIVVSCKSHEKCPAYSKAKTSNAEKVA